LKFTPTSIPDVLLIEPKVFSDERGFFFEDYNREVFARHGLLADFVQDNHSRSRRGALRGLHFQVYPKAEVLYKVTDFYSPAHDKGLAWNDPALGIAWPKLDVPYEISPKDRRHPALSELAEAS